MKQLRAFMTSFWRLVSPPVLLFVQDLGCHPSSQRKRWALTKSKLTVRNSLEWVDLMKLDILQERTVSQWILFYIEVLGFNILALIVSVLNFSAAINQPTVLYFSTFRFSMMLLIKLKTGMIWLLGLMNSSIKWQSCLQGNGTHPYG